MIQLALNEVEPGMVLARPIMGENGHLLLASGFVLDERILSKCRRMEMNALWIHEEDVHVIPDVLINEQLGYQVQGALQKNLEMMKKVVETKGISMDTIRQICSDSSRFRNILATIKMKSLVLEILEALSQREAAMLNLASIRTKSGYFYQHALDVTITAILIASRLRYSNREMEELAMGCLLMDFGMVILSDNLLQKPFPLSDLDQAILKEHPTMGYAILKVNEGITVNAAHVAYQHHEHQDGTGFPRGLKGDNQIPLKQLSPEAGKIHRYAEIASVADAYISRLSPPPNTVPPLAPDEALREIITLAGTRLNRSVVDLLVTMIPIFPVGARITVVDDPIHRTTGYLGIVAKANLEDPEKPVIALLFGRDRKKIEPIILDLREQRHFRIQFAPL